MLTEVARMQEGSEAKVVYDHPQNAAWSGTQGGRELDINDGQEHRANLFSVSRPTTSGEYFIVPRTAHPDARLGRVLSVHDTYRLKVHASSKTTAPKEMCFLFFWNGTIEDAHVVETKS